MVGRRTFLVSAANLWNGLPAHFISARSLMISVTILRLFQCFYLDLIIQHSELTLYCRPSSIQATLKTLMMMMLCFEDYWRNDSKIVQVIIAVETRGHLGNSGFDWCWDLWNTHRRRRRGQGGGTCPHEIREKIFFGQLLCKLLCKIRAIFGQNHVTFGNFVNFSGKYKNLGILIIFRARFM